MKKEELSIYPFGSLNNAAIRLYAPKEYYKIKRNGDVKMLVKVGITSRIRVRLIQ